MGERLGRRSTPGEEYARARAFFKRRLEEYGNEKGEYSFINAAIDGLDIANRNLPGDIVRRSAVMISYIEQARQIALEKGWKGEEMLLEEKKQPFLARISTQHKRKRAA